MTSSAYLCAFHDLEISAAFLDDIMQQPDQPDLEFMVMYETRSLRYARARTGAWEGARPATPNTQHHSRAREARTPSLPTKSPC